MPGGNPNWLKGKSGNPAGKPPGAVTAIQIKIKEAFAMLLENKLPQLSEWIDRIAKDDPDNAATLMVEISKRFVPTLQSTKIEGEITTRMLPPTIVKSVSN